MRDPFLEIIVSTHCCYVPFSPPQLALQVLTCKAQPFLLQAPPLDRFTREVKLGFVLFLCLVSYESNTSRVLRHDAELSRVGSEDAPNALREGSNNSKDCLSVQSVTRASDLAFVGTKMNPELNVDHIKASLCPVSPSPPCLLQANLHPW